MSTLHVPTGSYMNPDAERDMAYTVQAVGEIIRDLYPDMHIARLPTGKAGLMHVPRDGKPPYIVRELDDSEINANLLTWIIEHDQTRVDIMGTIENYNRAAKLLEAKEQELRVAEGHEFAKAVVQSKKHYYRHDGRVYS